MLDTKAALAPQSIQSECRTLFETIMALSRRQQRRLVAAQEPDYLAYLSQKSQAAQPVEDPRVLYQGVPGAYAEEAAAVYCGEGGRRRGLASWEDVFAAVERGEADYGVVPIENSSTGSINQVYGLLAKYEHFIVGEVKLRVDHCLMAPAGVGLEDIQTVYSHEQGLFQCEPYLKEHPGWRRTALSNTAAAAKFVAESGQPYAAIGSERCAKLWPGASPRPRPTTPALWWWRPGWSWTPSATRSAPCSPCPTRWGPCTRSWRSLPSAG